MESLITGGLFVKSALPQSLVKTVRVAPNSSLVLVDSLGSMKIASLAERVNANRLKTRTCQDFSYFRLSFYFRWWQTLH
ncbi:hypothetical protein [Limosilactobacillus sp.]|uniref:hypothetical protein n=1 Tax=Limosilactobacillus sp. TaxID=2773925 RepID=UPI0035A0ABA3